MVCVRVRAVAIQRRTRSAWFAIEQPIRASCLSLGTSSSAAVILLEVGLDRILAVLGCTGVFCPVFGPVDGCWGRCIDSALLDLAPVDVISSRSSLSPPPSALGTRRTRSFEIVRRITKSIVWLKSVGGAPIGAPLWARSRGSSSHDVSAASVFDAWSPLVRTDNGGRERDVLGVASQAAIGSTVKSPLVPIHCRTNVGLATVGPTLSKRISILLSHSVAFVLASVPSLRTNDNLR